MNKVVLQFNEDQLTQIVQALSYARNKLNFFKFALNTFQNKCIDCGVEFQEDQDLISVKSMPNHQEYRFSDEYRVVENNGDYFVVGDDWFSVKCKNKTQAIEQCYQLNLES